MSEHTKRCLTYKMHSSKAQKPMKKYCCDVGYELYSSESVVLRANARALVNTDLSFTFPLGYYGFVVPIKKFAYEYSIDVASGVVENELNTLNVLMINNSNQDFEIK